MKTLLKTQAELIDAGRCDIDYHLPAEHLLEFPKTLITRVDQVADIVTTKRNPKEAADQEFKYVDISSVDIKIGRVINPQDMLGSDAPSRARKVIRTGDVIVSTCRPTRGAITIVPDALDDQICSTAFSVVRAKPSEVIPAFLHWVLRLPSTLEQFRKWSTGSSYPAILDEDVEKTLVPIPNLIVQKEIMADIAAGLHRLDQTVSQANERWHGTLDQAEAKLKKQVQ